MNKHLTFDDRVTIEQELSNGTSVAEIAKILGKNRTTISREIMQHRESRESNGNNCIHRAECLFPTHVLSHANRRESIAAGVTAMCASVCVSDMRRNGAEN